MESRIFWPTARFIWATRMPYKTLLEIILNSTAMDLKNTAETWLSDGEYILTVMPEEESSLIESKVDRNPTSIP